MAGAFCSDATECSQLSVKHEHDTFSYRMAESREYMRRASDDKVEDLAAAESEDQYHQSFRKYCVLIMSSSVIVA